MRTATLLCTLVLCVGVAADDEKPSKPKIDIVKILKNSKEFQEKLKSFGMSYEDGVVRAQGEIVYRGGGPCEYLVNVYPAKAHETIVLLDNGPWEGEGRRPRRLSKGLAITLNNAFLCAGFQKGSPFSWNQEGDVFPPKGEVVYIYCEWKDAEGKVKRAAMHEWLWNYKTHYPMKPGHFVYTGSQMIDEGPPKHRKWFGAEVDGLLVAVMNTSTAMLDNTEEGGEENGVYEAIPARIPSIGTRVNVVFSKKPLDGAVNHKPLRLPKEVLEARKKREAEKKAEAAKKKAEEVKKAAKKDEGE